VAIGAIRARLDAKVADDPTRREVLEVPSTADAC
jgi:hypothetical protein